MKKLFAMAWGVLLFVNAVPALADGAIEFSGYYSAYFLATENVSHNTGWNKNLTDDWTDSDQFFLNRLNLDLAYKPVEEFSMVLGLRGSDKESWSTSARDKDQDPSLELLLRQFYAKLVQDWGSLAVGRIDNVDGAGLATLGYAPISAGSAGDESFLHRSPFDWNTPTDMLYYEKEWNSGFGLRGYYAKHGTEAYPEVFDEDTFDQVMVESSYKWGGGGASLALWMERNNDEDSGPVRKSAWYINPAIAYSSGEWSGHAEMMYGWGKAYTGNPGVTDDVSGYGFYADVDYNYGSGNVNIGGWYASGTKFDAARANNLVGMGDFAPLLVMFYNQTMGFGTWSMDAAAAAGNFGYTPGPGNQFNGGYASNGNGGANQWGLVIGGKHAVTDYLAIDWAVGYSELVYPTARWANDWFNPTDWDYGGTDLGWEFDLGVTFTLLDNHLQISSMCGYLIAGSAFDYLTGWDTNGVPIVKSGKDSFAWVSTVTLRF